MQVGLTIVSTVRERHDVVNTIGLGYRTPAQTFLTQSLIPLEDPQLNHTPTAAVTALMPTLARLIIAPAFTSMFTTESAGISRCIAAAAFTAGFRRAGRHSFALSYSYPNNLKWEPDLSNNHYLSHFRINGPCPCDVRRRDTSRGNNQVGRIICWLLSAFIQRETITIGLYCRSLTTICYLNPLSREGD